MSSSFSTSRVALFDELRGLAIVSVVLYHTFWNLRYIFQVNIRWFPSFYTELWQLFGSCIFFVLAGMCTVFSRNAWKRVRKPALGALAVTFFSLLATPDLPIYFGVLHCLASCLFLFAIFKESLSKIPPQIGLFSAFLCSYVLWDVPSGGLTIGSYFFALPNTFYVSFLTGMLGFPPANFQSADYFPIIPYFFVFLMGYFFVQLLPLDKMRSETVCPPLVWLGKQSIWIYLLHQPIIYGGMMLYFNYLS